MNHKMIQEAAERFVAVFGAAHTAAAYAPGRVEVLGNHTDYNEGFVLSGAIDCGVVFLAAPSAEPHCRLVAADLGEEITYPAAAPAAVPGKTWANFVVGVQDGLLRHGARPQGFNALLRGDVPRGAGLASSAALEIASGLALAALYGIAAEPLDLARIGQRAEHEFVGAKTGLLDQITSLHGKANGLVLTDFRSLAVENVPLGEDVCLLMANTGVTHSLVESAYNERRTRCEQAAAWFAEHLDHPVQTLRDVTEAELQAHGAALDPVVARRAAHILGENRRVLEGRARLEAGELDAFGRLMFESHGSSRDNFENSCPELDFLVDAAGRIPGVLGARLSGGGFGGSAIVLLHPRDVDHVSHALAAAYERPYGRHCETRPIRPSAGARLLT